MMTEHLSGWGGQNEILLYTLLLYLCLLSWKHALNSQGELRAIGFAAGLFLIPSLLLTIVTHGSEVFGVGACYDDPTRWWNFTLVGVDAGSPRTLNLLSATLLLSSLFVGVTAAVGLLCTYFNLRRGKHIHALHKVLIVWVAVTTGLLIYLKSNDVNLTPLLFGMGALSIIIGLALQDPLANFFAGIALDLDGTIRREDWIKVSGDASETIGKVVDKGWRSTRLLTLDNELVIMPNRVIAGTKILNYHRPERQHVHTLVVGVSYNTPPIKVKEVLRTILLREPAIAKNPPPEVQIVNYGESSIDYKLRFWLEDYGQSQKVKDLVRTHIWYAFRTNNIEIAFPTRIIHHQNPVQRTATRSLQDEMTMQLASFLQGIPLMNRNLNRQDLEFMALNAHRRIYAPGEHILARGVAGDSLYIIEEGSCEVVLPVGVRQLGCGDFFGEMSLLAGGVRSADVLAGSSGSTLIRIDRGCMETVFRFAPGLREELIRTREERHQESGVGQLAVSTPPPALTLKIRQALRHYLLPW